MSTLDGCVQDVGPAPPPATPPDAAGEEDDGGGDEEALLGSGRAVPSVDNIMSLSIHYRTRRMTSVDL